MLALLHSETVLANQESEPRAFLHHVVLKKKMGKTYVGSVKVCEAGIQLKVTKCLSVNVNQLRTAASPQQECSAASL